MNPGGWAEFAAAWAAFLVSHALPARPAVRRRLTASLGEAGYQIVYGAVSVAAIAWLIAAAGRAPLVPLWSTEIWQMWLANLAAPLACLLVAFAVGAPNPLSFGGPAAGFDPSRPGVVGVARHPLLVALALWAGVHTLANGDLAHVLLFGGFGGFAVLGMRALDRRRRRELGEAEWARLSACASDWPLAALLAGRWRPQSPPNAARFVLGLALWLVLLALHPLVIGVSPLPPS
ncbi:putative membrane protein [Roseiarcus fermentans]|uniref:Putative membrane protein n=1 Tax=Roseiarcus fermentans TaxID=1473586 RepID=A0A366FRD0_9HYPH|nr:NnrU family protein [Roseiarcus fermentans]RBP17234.1 putative membrane protein [Roseiarcus fermentans]